MNTTIKARNRILSFALAICLLLTMVLVVPGPVTAQAAKIEGGPPDVEVYKTVIGFAGKEWWVIGDGSGSKGIQSDNNDCVILLAKNQEFGICEFGDSLPIYPDQTLHKEMQKIHTGFGREKDLVETRAIDEITINHIESTTVTLPDQNVWPLSGGEYNIILSETQESGVSEILKYSGGQELDWGLRSAYKPGMSPSVGAGSASGGSSVSTDATVKKAIRPAFQLNLSSVIFTSSAASGGKSVATEGRGLVRASAPTQNLKLTVIDPGMSLNGVSSAAINRKARRDLSYCLYQRQLRQRSLYLLFAGKGRCGAILRQAGGGQQQRRQRPGEAAN